MGERDYAVVCGINNYPAFSPLGGPERDARAFYAWLLKDAKVPDHNIKKVFSSDFAAENAAGVPVYLTKPTFDALNAAFAELRALAFQNFQNIPRIGRRLYIFLAGHGITPRTSNPSGTAALLMANAEPQSPGEHLSGPAYAEWFRRAHAFEEILLFMDCCRNAIDDIDERPVPFGPLKGGRPEDVKTFQALATQWDAPSFEQPIGTPPEARGVFTYALIQTFNSVRDENGRLLASNLYGGVRIIINQLRNGDVPQFPKLTLGDQSQDIVIIEDVNVVLPRVTIEWDAALVGKALGVLSGDGKPLSPAINLTTTSAPTVINLRAGLYQVTSAPGQFDTLKVQPGLIRQKQEIGHVTVE